MAFGDVVVPRLKGIAKAIYTGGRFVAVTDGAAVFALENAPTRDRAEKHRLAVEGLLADHFGRPVPIRLIIESEAGAVAKGSGGALVAGSAGASGRSPAGTSGDRGREAASRSGGPFDPAVTAETSDGGAAAAAGADADDADDAGEEASLMTEVDELEDADVSTSGVDKLAAAFPGAELIEAEPTETREPR